MAGPPLRLVRRGLLMGSVMPAMFGAAAFGADLSHASSAPATASRPLLRANPASCAQSQRPAQVAHNAWAQARERLAPTGPDAIRLCRYAGLNDPPPGRLVRSRLLSDSALVTRLVRQFNELPPFPPGGFACPSDDGSQILAQLAYPNGKQVTIAFELTGCQGVSNGDLVRIANGYGSHPRLGPHLLTELEQLAK
jgi:hypothetical protein